MFIRGKKGILEKLEKSYVAVSLESLCLIPLDMYDMCKY